MAADQHLPNARAANAHQPPSPDIMTLLSTWGDNLSTQTSKAFNNLGPKDYIRLVVIIGGYLLLRQWLVKLGAHRQLKQLEHQDAEAKRQARAEELADANDLRVGAKKSRKPKIALPGVDSDDDDSSEEESAVRPGEWGRAARLRQRKFVRDALEKHEQKLQAEAEAESDKDIEEFLIKE
ncbi:uncharacterized protein K452DRAFT_225158 [Aplosporella prunicola CBS 121167]|uniref:DUF1531-domain-containing protein n=1 Tax=Aplosporella prunicola CBS 121167 TaxID=1176127 RepID=A0A6A6BGC3_9PEZI|nr:uncharacterized protein K452DRAFT_225158 [Aplosporella prunicola CBS 121167]KAF2143222.1 hypothetical protein K452DRAFT_225158 [Aplosporella prunicola CBS 121167]